MIRNYFRTFPLCIMLGLSGFLLSGCDTAIQSETVVSAVETSVIEEIYSPKADHCSILYVAIDGSDETGTGSISAPLATVNHALEIALPGDEIILRGGTYTTQGEIKVEKDNITIRSADGEVVVVQAPYDNEDISFCFWFSHEASGGNLIGMDISGGNYYTVKFDSDWDWDKSRAYSLRSGASNMLVQDCIIHDSGADLIKITPGCDDIVIENCELYNSGLLITDNAEGVDNVNGDRMIVRNCYIHDIATNGLYCKGGATDCIVECTVVERCGEGGIFLGFDTSPEWFDLDANPDYYEAISCSVYNCIIQDTNLAGIALYASDRCKVYNNTLINTAKTAHAPLYFGVTYQDWDADADRPANKNPFLVNNIICQIQPIDAPAILIRYSGDLGGLSGLAGDAVIDNNCYYFSKRNVYFEDNRPGMEFSGGLQGWQEHMGTDICSMIADPLLDTSARLMQNSACIDAGQPVVGLSKDIDGDSRLSLPDIGADEYTGTD